MVRVGVGFLLDDWVFFPQSTLRGILLAIKQLKTSGDVKQTWSHAGDPEPNLPW